MRRTLRAGRKSSMISRTDRVFVSFVRQTAGKRVHKKLQRLPDECLNASVFQSLADAPVKLDAGRRDYNQVQPHGFLGQLTPTEFAARHGWRLKGPDERGKTENCCSSTMS